jgi:hypothetical protein
MAKPGINLEILRRVVGNDTEMLCVVAVAIPRRPGIHKQNVGA